MDPTRAAAIQHFASGSGVNPYVDQAISAAIQPMIMQQNAELGRRIPGQFAAAGHNLGAGGSSPYQRALGESAYLSQRAIGDTAGAVGLNAFNQAQQAQLQGIQLGQQDVGAMLQNVQAQYLPQAILEQGIDRAINVGQQGRQNILQGLQIAQGYPLQQTGNVSQGVSTQGGTTQGTSYSPNPNLMAGLFGNQGLFGGLNSLFAPTTQGASGQIDNSTIYNTPGFNPFSGLFG